MENKKFLDILFENRNKAYGAYELRLSENRSLMKALFSGVGIVAIGMGGFVYSNKISTEIIQNDQDGIYDSITIVHIDPIDKPIEPPVEEPEQIKRLQENTKQIKEIVPTPTASPPIQETLVDRADLKDADLGAENREGEKPSTSQVGGGDVSDGETNVTGSQNNNDIKKGTTPIEVKAPEAPRKAISTKHAKVMAIYPGCEKEVKKGNDALTKCLSEKLSSDLASNLEHYASIAQRENVTKAMAKMQFIIDKNGEITRINPASGSDKALGKEAAKALEQINARLKRRGNQIKPAQHQDGTDADLIFSIPVRFQQE